MFSSRELETLLAALLFWQEEQAEQPPEFVRPYFTSLGLTGNDPLSAAEIEQLSARLRAQFFPIDPPQS